MTTQNHPLKDHARFSDELHIFSESRFLHVLRQERARSDRNDQAFSLAIFKVYGLQNNRESEAEFIELVARRIRLTDHIGWFNRRTLGVILPETPAKGAWKVVREIREQCRPLGSEVECTVYTYPRQSLPQLDSAGGENGQSLLSRSGHHAATKPSDRATANREPTEKGQTIRAEAIEPVMLRSGHRTKRLVDILGASLLLALLSPLFLVIAVAIKYVSKGPAIFSQTRLGYLGRPFRFYKFRTMEHGASTVAHLKHLDRLITKDTPMTKLDAGDDMRVFPLGRVLRQTMLDELPQLVNVLRGEMSLVGPRPCMPYEALNYARWQHRRFDCLPGMTGLWQVSGKNRTTFKEMIRMDITYASKRSLLLDLMILFRTIPFVFQQVKLTLNSRQNVKR